MDRVIIKNNSCLCLVCFQLLPTLFEILYFTFGLLNIFTFKEVAFNLYFLDPECFVEDLIATAWKKESWYWNLDLLLFLHRQIEETSVRSIYYLNTMRVMRRY